MQHQLVYVIPVGPFCHDQHVADTIESIVFFDKSASIVVVDDSGREEVKLWQLTTPNLKVLKTRGGSGKGPGLFHILALGYRELLCGLQDHIVGIVRMDTDALVIGPGLAEDVADYFKKSPKAGIIGSHKVASNGTVRDYEAVGKRVQHLSSLWWPVRHPRRVVRQPRLIKAWVRFRCLVRKARCHGYDWVSTAWGELSLSILPFWLNGIPRAFLVPRCSTILASRKTRFLQF